MSTVRAVTAARGVIVAYKSPHVAQNRGSIPIYLYISPQNLQKSPPDFPKNQVTLGIERQRGQREHRDHRDIVIPDTIYPTTLPTQPCSFACVPKANRIRKSMKSLVADTR